MPFYNPCIRNFRIYILKEAYFHLLLWHIHHSIDILHNENVPEILLLQTPYSCDYRMSVPKALPASGSGLVPALVSE